MTPEQRCARVLRHAARHIESGLPITCLRTELDVINAAFDWGDVVMLSIGPNSETVLALLILAAAAEAGDLP